MKSFFGIFLALTVSAAYAEEYGTYTDDFDNSADEYIDNSDCVCDCDSDCATKTTKRDNYTGIRLYKNKHAAYKYTVPSGHHENYTTDNYGFGTVMGNRLTDFARLEYETLYMGAEHSKYNHDFNYDIWANFLNVYLYQEYGHAIAPYVGAGIGLTALWGEMDNELDNAVDLSYQFMVGLLFELNTRVELDLGFKYSNFGRVEHEYGVSKVDATQLYLGAAYRFAM